jgi:hypothetical protein
LLRWVILFVTARSNYFGRVRLETDVVADVNGDNNDNNDNDDVDGTIPPVQQWRSGFFKGQI